MEWLDSLGYYAASCVGKPCVGGGKGW
jgi:hypothetical protein